MGNCWVLAGMSTLPEHKDFFKKVVPPNQSFEKGKYTGKFKFRFWQYGKWVPVVVDDYLPTVKGRLILCKSDDKNEFWPALLEKAYAKLYGSYGALMSGNGREILPDLSGGIIEYHKLDRVPHDLFDIMVKAKRNGALMYCGTSLKKDYKGLHASHGFAVTNAIKVKGNSGTRYELVRIRDPHGNGGEWTGRWSDETIKKWLPAATRAKYNIVDKDDGEFYMCMDDFLKLFHSFYICHLSVASVRRLAPGGNIGLKGYSCHGSWKGNGGGNQPHKASFAKNPRYKFTIKDNSKDRDKMATLIVDIMEKKTRSHHGKRHDRLSIGFFVYRWDGKTKVNSRFFRNSRPVATSKFTTEKGKNTLRLTLKPGTYYVVPCTSKPYQKGDFYMRVYAEI